MKYERHKYDRTLPLIVLCASMAAFATNYNRLDNSAPNTGVSVRNNIEAILNKEEDLFSPIETEGLNPKGKYDPHKGEPRKYI